MLSSRFMQAVRGEWPTLLRARLTAEPTGRGCVRAAPQRAQQRLDELNAVDDVRAQQQVKRAVRQRGADVLFPAPIKAASGSHTEARSGRCVARDVPLQVRHRVTSLRQQHVTARVREHDAKQPTACADLEAAHRRTRAARVRLPALAPGLAPTLQLQLDPLCQ